jgi:hypothetical protein
LLEGVRRQTKPRAVDLYEVFCGVLYLLKLFTLRASAIKKLVVEMRPVWRGSRQPIF